MDNVYLQIRVLFFLILLNFAALIPYQIHLYYSPGHPFPNPRGTLVVALIFAVFITGYLLFMKKKTIGYWLLLFFLSMEFIFYLYNFTGTLRHGYPLFFQIHNRDILLRIVYSIGYLNLFASGYFVFLLLYYKKKLL